MKKEVELAYIEMVLRYPPYGEPGNDWLRLGFLS